MSEEEVKFGINLGALFPDGDTEKEEQTPIKEEETENEEPAETGSEDEVEESPTPKKEVEAPVVQETKPLPEVDTKDEPELSSVDYLHAKWGDLGVSKEDLQGDQFKAILEVVEELQNEIKAAKSKNKELENHPAIAEVRISQEVEKMWSDNIKDWEEELKEAIPDEYKQIQKLNKKQSKELVEFISKASSEIMYSKLKSSKKVNNPLLLIAPKILNKVKGFSEEPKKEVEAEKPQPKKMASVSGGSVKPQQEQYVDTKKIAPKMMPAQASFMANMNKLFGS